MQMKVIDELMKNSLKTLSLCTAFVLGTSSTLQPEEPKNYKELVESYHQAQISKKSSGDSKRVVQSTVAVSVSCYCIFVLSLTLLSFGSS